MAEFFVDSADRSNTLQYKKHIGLTGNLTAFAEALNFHIPPYAKDIPSTVDFMRNIPVGTNVQRTGISEASYPEGDGLIFLGLQETLKVFFNESNSRANNTDNWKDELARRYDISSSAVVLVTKASIDIKTRSWPLPKGYAVRVPAIETTGSGSCGGSQFSCNESLNVIFID